MKHNLPIKIELPEHFLEEEVRCDYTVSQKQKKIWAVELDLLCEFMRVCEKYQLRWFISYGSLLGVIRHKGFIPWDNDIDLNMPRADFRKLCEVAEKEFAYPYFLQTPISEKGRYFTNMCKFCNSETTGASELEWLQGINGGMYLDVFILDDIPDDDREVQKLFDYKHHLTHLCRFLSPYPRKDKGLGIVKNWVWTLLWKTKYHECKGDGIYQMIDNRFGSNIGKGYRRMCAIEQTFERSIRFDKKAWTHTLWMDFEFIKVPVPNGYDEILEDHYPNYMQLPPIEKRVNHEYLNLEPEISYKDFFAKKYGKK